MMRSGLICVGLLALAMPGNLKAQASKSQTGGAAGKRVPNAGKNDADSSKKGKDKATGQDVSDLIALDGAKWTAIAKGSDGKFKRFKFVTKSAKIFNEDDEASGQIAVLGPKRADIKLSNLPIVGTIRAVKVRKGEWGGKLKNKSGEFDVNIYRDGMAAPPNVR